MLAHGHWLLELGQEVVRDWAFVLRRFVTTRDVVLGLAATNRAFRTQFQANYEVGGEYRRRWRQAHEAGWSRMRAVCVAFSLKGRTRFVAEQVCRVRPRELRWERASFVSTPTPTSRMTAPPPPPPVAVEVQTLQLGLSNSQVAHYYQKLCVSMREHCEPNATLTAAHWRSLGMTSAQAVATPNLVSLIIGGGHYKVYMTRFLASQQLRSLAMTSCYVKSVLFSTCFGASRRPLRLLDLQFPTTHDRAMCYVMSQLAPSLRTLRCRLFWTPTLDHLTSVSSPPWLSRVLSWPKLHTLSVDWVPNSHSPPLHIDAPRLHTLRLTLVKRHTQVLKYFTTRTLQALRDFTLVLPPSELPNHQRTYDMETADTTLAALAPTLQRLVLLLPLDVTVSVGSLPHGLVELELRSSCVHAEEAEDHSGSGDVWLAPNAPRILLPNLQRFTGLPFYLERLDAPALRELVWRRTRPTEPPGADKLSASTQAALAAWQSKCSQTLGGGAEWHLTLRDMYDARVPERCAAWVTRVELPKFVSPLFVGLVVQSLSRCTQLRTLHVPHAHDERMVGCDALRRWAHEHKVEFVDRACEAIALQL